MSSYAPPSYVVSIYNPAYFTTSSGGLTLAQATAQFLNKNSADTASALETFTAGIATNSIATTSLASNMTIGSSSNTGTITIATTNTGNTDTNPAISIGADAGTKTIKINNNSNSVHCSSVDLQGSSINNITATTGALSVGDGQTDGILNIGTGTRTATGVVNIANAASNACAINVMNGNTTSGSVNIATGTGLTQTTTVNIGSGNTTGAVTIGNSGNTVQINGGLTMGNSRNITLQSNSFYSAPTADTMLGGVTVGTFNTPSSSFSAAKDVATITLLKGSYLIFWSFNATWTSIPTTQYLTVGGTATASPSISSQFGSGLTNSGSINNFSGSFPVNITAGGTLTLRYNLVGTINSISLYTLSAVRIA
jgi:hypothetical protein